MPHRNASLAASAGLALTLVAIQFAVILVAPTSMLVRIVLPATIALVPAALWAHRRYMGVWVILVGLAANLAAILANGGLMPIEERTVVEGVGAEKAAEYRVGAWIAGSKDVLVANGAGRLTPLGDSIVVHLGSDGFAASPGDVVVFAGMVVVAAQASLEWQRRTRAARHEQIAARAALAASARAEGSAPPAR